MIRDRQQDRLKQVRAEKELLEQQEKMLKLREEQLVRERRRQVTFFHLKYIILNFLINFYIIYKSVKLYLKKGLL